ncbi:MAG: zinc ribbon domain-containing protein [Campylobacterota bacterium]|nr:zinc ribbon domain-containing protein [Campylobacterota bacterium]
MKIILIFLFYIIGVEANNYISIKIPSNKYNLKIEGYTSCSASLSWSNRSKNFFKVLSEPNDIYESINYSLSIKSDNEIFDKSVYYYLEVDDKKSRAFNSTHSYNYKNELVSYTGKTDTLPFSSHSVHDYKKVFYEVKNAQSVKLSSKSDYYNVAVDKVQFNKELSECRKWIDREKEELFGKRNKLKFIYGIIALIGIFVIFLILKSLLSVIKDKIKKRKEQHDRDTTNAIVKDETIRARVKKSIEEEVNNADASNQTLIFCSECGHQVNSSDNFCNICGKNLKG